jgi:glycosyltransferase involved in cell wall biosynthesis
MRVLAWVHMYPPNHCAGAEMMLHEILLGLRARGNEVHVMCNENPATEFDGIPITVQDNRDSLNLINWADIIITHLDKTVPVILAVGNRKPIVHIVHNEHQLSFNDVTPQYAQLIVANSKWVAGELNWPEPENVMVVPPPVDADRYRVTPGTRITLINMNENKGARVFWKLAEQLPDLLFLAVKGGYYKQIIPEEVPQNVAVMEHTPDITTVYRRTRILLMPSAYESWGRVAIEAAASGIPTIATPTPGLRESLGNSGIFVARDNLKGWVSAIRALQDDAEYSQRAERAYMRSKVLDPSPDLDRLNGALRAIAGRWAARGQGLRVQFM